MAKSRRIIRKVKHGDNAFDDQLWPVFFALLILGGFLEGVTINFVPWFGPIYFNKLVYMIMIPVFIALSMVVISQIKSRTMRRGLQFAIILSLCIHIGFFIFANGHTVIRFVQDILVADVSKAREVKTVPDYQEFQINPEAYEKPDFLKPVETKTEEPELEKVEKKEPDPKPEEPKEKPPEPEPKKPEPEKPKPEPIKKKTPEQAVPKASPTRSMRSRQVVKVNVPKLPTKVETPKPATQPKQQPSQHQAKSTPTPTKSNPTEAKVRQKPVETEAVAQTQPKAVELNRRKTEPEKVTTTQPAKSTPRRTPTPTPQPIVKTEVTPVQSSQSQKVASKSPTAKQAVAQKRDSTSPTTAKQAPKEPLPERPTQVAQVSATRQQQTEKAPTLNSSQKPTVSRATRSPIVPNINTLAQPNATNQAANPTTEPKVAARTVPKVNRQTNQPPTPSRAPSPTSVPTPARSAAIVAQASPTKATSSSRPTPNPTAAPSVSKAIARANRPSLTFSKPVATPSSNQTPSANPTQSTAKAITTSTSRTAHTGPTIPNKASVSAPQAPSPSPKATSVAAATTSRATTATSAPRTSAQTSNNVARSSARSVKAPSTTAITVNSSPAPTTNATKAAGAVAKASSNTRVRKAASARSTAQSASPVAMAAPSANPSQRAATASATRRSTSAVPTLQPNAAPGQSPSRSVTSAKIAASPAAIASPSRAVSTRATNNPSAAPTRTSLTKADQGTSTAGVGQAPNMDRGVPAANRTALAASASAQRSEATQKAQPGPAISPSAPAAISRSRAGANIPKAVVTATQVENATMAAAQTSTDAVASASAAVKKSDASAKESNITAAKGTTEIDLGPNRIVSSEEQKNLRGRPAGGGQPVLNTTTQATPLARSNSGGSPAVAINTNVKAVQAEAPAATGGGQPAATEIAAANSSATRAESGGGLPEEGGPNDEDEEDEENKDKAGGAVAAKAIGRATSSEQTPGAPADGGGQASPARSASTRSLVANIQVAAPAASAPAASGDGQPAGAPAAAATSIARTDASGGAPTEGGPSNASESGAANPGSGAPSVAQAIGRAATSDAGGPPAAGGGTGSPTRSATSRLIAASTQAVVLVRAATGDLSGSAGGPATARGTELARADTASTGGGPAGGETSEPAMSQSANIAGAPGMGRRSDATGDAGGPQVSASASSGSPGRRSSRTGIQMGALAAIDVPAASPGAPTAEPNIAALMGGGSNTGVARQASGGLNVELALAPAGPGGLGSEFAANAGISSRQAHADSEVVHSDTARFLQRTAGGSVAVNAGASLAKEGFAGRDLGTRPTGGGANGAPPPKTNETIELGLQFLSRQQLIDGSWSLRELRGKPESEKTPVLHTNTAATGMSLLAFLGAGYHHKDHKYQEVVAGGINSLVSHQQENGDLYENLDDFSTGSVRFYSHGIATIALCEAYGMTRDPDLREPAQKAIDYIVKTQHKTRGGWRYSPVEAQRESDTSVTGWMMMALKSGELSGLEVPPETFDKIEKWLDASQASKSERHLYRYNPHAQDTKLQRHGRKPNLTMTSVGLLMRLYTGWRRDNPNMIAGADHLVENLASNSRNGFDASGNQLNGRDAYYWYYATQVLFHMKGEYWAKWNAKLSPLLINGQVKTGPMAGSWDPYGPNPDRWAGLAGRLYVTSLNLLNLEVYYRHLPIYDDTAE